MALRAVSASVTNSEAHVRGYAPYYPEIRRFRSAIAGAIFRIHKNYDIWRCHRVAVVNLAISDSNFALGQNQFQGSSGQPNVRPLHSKFALRLCYYAICWLISLALFYIFYLKNAVKTSFHAVSDSCGLILRHKYLNAKSALSDVEISMS